MPDDPKVVSRKRKPQEPLKPERINRAQAAAILSVPERTVVYLAASGKLPGAAKIGRSWTYDEKALRALVRAKEDEAWARSEKPRRAATGEVTRFGVVSRLPASKSAEAYERAMEKLRKGA